MKRSMFGFVLCALGLVIAMDAVGEEKGKPRPQNITGVVSKVDANSLTIAQRGDGGERLTTFAVGAQTKIVLQTKDDQIVKGGEGGERKIPKTEEGKLTDVKVDQRVTVGFLEAGKAESVLVLRPAPPRKREGER